MRYEEGEMLVAMSGLGLGEGRGREGGSCHGNMCAWVSGGSEIEEKCYVMSGFILSFVDACTSKTIYVLTHADPYSMLAHITTYPYLLLLPCIECWHEDSCPPFFKSIQIVYEDKK
jgi:hypothetical protein